MKIREVAVSGFRSLLDVKVTNLGTVNIFFGDNNSGKSNLLDALEILFKVEQKELPVSGFYKSELSNFVDNFSIKDDGSITTSITIRSKIEMDDGDIAKLPIFIDFLNTNSLVVTRSQWLELEVEIEPVSADRVNRELKEAKINSHVMYDSSQAHPVCFFPSLEGKVDPGKRESAVGELIYYLINSFNKVNERSFGETSSFDQETGSYEIFSQQKYKKWLRALIESRGEKYETFKKIQGWFNAKPFTYGNIRPVLSDGEADLIIEDSLGRELIVERLGTGVHQILLLLSEVAARIVEEEVKIFGIEELELNISPHIQRETLIVLTDMVKDPSKSGFGQIFLTSHSPYLCNRDLGELYAVSIDKKNGTVITHGTNAIRKLIKYFEYDKLNLERRAR